MEADKEIYKVQGSDSLGTDGATNSSDPAASIPIEFTVAQLQEKYKQLRNDVGEVIKSIWDVETANDEDLKLRLLASLKQNECLLLYPDLYFARARVEIVQYNKYSAIDHPVQMLQWILENGPIGYLKFWETQQLKMKKVEWNINVRKLEADLQTYVEKLKPLINDIRKSIYAVANQPTKKLKPGEKYEIVYLSDKYAGTHSTGYYENAAVTKTKETHQETVANIVSKDSSGNSQQNSGKAQTNAKQNKNKKIENSTLCKLKIRF